ncbi:hypothetical protein UPYG_G00107010 [Umbra pygmaea]|uniref:Uncharacterized protein n=1 Tax=Umbra pygmaea TaxID=75934 RepID=A0ABD0X5U0_UMBPY
MRFQVAPHVFWVCHKSQSLLGPYHPKDTRRHHNTQRGTPWRHLEYQVEDFSSTHEEYFEKTVHLRAAVSFR